uniref:MSP domain-containing protein n=1 Tax=Parascaris equorum TaxID=6256 RepID=A0A914RSD6_PAREQ
MNVLTVEPRSAQFDATGGTPVYGFIEPQSITSFTIKRLSGEAADSKIIIQFAEVLIFVVL